MQVRCHSPSQQREIPTHSSFELCEFTRRKKSAFISVRIHIQTRLQRYFVGGGFIIVVMDLLFFFFNLISKQLLHDIKKAPLKLTAKQELARALYI